MNSPTQTTKTDPAVEDAGTAAATLAATVVTPETPVVDDWQAVVRGDVSVPTIGMVEEAILQASQQQHWQAVAAGDVSVPEIGMVEEALLQASLLQ